MNEGPLEPDEARKRLLEWAREQGLTTSQPPMRRVGRTLARSEIPHSRFIVVGNKQLTDTGRVDEELRLEVALFAALRRLAKASGEAPKGLDRGGYWVLAKLASLAPIRLSDLAVALELDPSTVSRHIKTLWHAGLVGRESDPDDRRAALLTPTDAGRRGARSLAPAAAAGAG